jgi:acetyl-CoA carboxylase biotin carboxylase subunit
MLKKVLIANRGEIAIRIARTLRELGSGVVTLFTEVDRASAHVGFGDEAIALGSNPRAYLEIEQIVRAARDAGADAIHPGYGFLSENAEFAEAVERAGMTFIGPPARAIAAMANKQRARALMSAAGVPIVPGGRADSLAEAVATANSIGYPILLKAADGGGGKGMRRVEAEHDLPAAFERTRSEALAAFRSSEVYVEKALSDARHVEIQVLGDREGTTIHLYDRDCSIQRRHQKVVEETPCPALPPELLAEMASVALRGAAALGYYSAGTFEFLLDGSGRYYFLEMNTRIQVEHAITELVTGVDIVREMVRVAAGERLVYSEPPPRRGVAIEARVCAEDPEHDFLPSPGRIGRLREPSGPGVRVDSGVRPGSVIGADYDPLMAKLCVWAPDREQALARLIRALSEYVVLGLQTNLEYLRRLVADEAFARGQYDIGFVGRRPDLRRPQPLTPELRADWVAALAALELARRPKGAAPSAPPSAALPAWVLAERSRWR